MTDDVEISQAFSIIHELDYVSATDVASIMFTLFEGDFRCVSTKNSMWYFYNKQVGKWEKAHGGFRLQRKISTVLCEWLRKYLDELVLLQVSRDNSYCDSSSAAQWETIPTPNRDSYRKRYRNIAQLMLRLGENTFKMDVMEACDKLFYTDLP